jgi:pimeloyl-ACP methyl ester carboxylesterase
MKKIFTLLVLLITLLGLTACGEKATPTAGPTETATPAETAPEPTAAFEPAPCPLALPPSVVQGQDIVCGHVTVPEEHAHPDGETIRLAVAVIKSTSDAPAPAPLVVEAGGPGGSTLAGVPSMLVWADLRARRDIVLVEQRGTLYSRPHLLCREVLDLTGKTDGQNLDREETLALEIKALSACRDRLVTQGVNLSAYNSLENAADIVMALTALGYDEFNLYGVSYATMLAQHIMRDYPDRLRSVILDSVAPLSVNGIAQLPHSTDRAFRLLFESCAADPVCDHHFPDLETVFFDLVEELDENPVSVHFEASAQTEELMTGNRLLGQLFDSLQRGSVPFLPANIYAMAAGDYGLMTKLGASPSLPKGILINGMSLSVLCAEEMDYTDADLRHPQFGDFFRDAFDMRDYCAVWSVERLDDEMGAAVVSDVPTLVLSGEFDPNTPPGGGSLVAETLSKSYAYTFPGISHNVLSNSPCAQSIALEFLDDPTREPDASCIADMGLQFVVPTDAIKLQPFSDKTYNVQGLLPAAWASIGPGTFAGLNSRRDVAVLQMVRLPNLPLDQHLSPRLQRLGVDTLVESSSRRETATLTWDLYTFQGYRPSLGGTVMVDWAIAEADSGIYLVGLYALLDDYEALHEAVFMPVVDALAPLQ